MNPVVHFEMPYEDRDRMATFYEKAFGWKTQKLGEEMGNYVVAHTADTDANNMVKNPGQINGGFFKKSPDNAGPSIVIAVQDIESAMKAVADAGGKLPTLAVKSRFSKTTNHSTSQALACTQDSLTQKAIA
jgi:uncharacterized protein